YNVRGELRGISEPCLFPNHVACHCPPLGKASACPKLTLYSKEVFATHAHGGETSKGEKGTRVIEEPEQELEPVPDPQANEIREAVEKSKRTKTQSLVYAEKIVLCECKPPTWADVNLYHHSNGTLSFRRVCYCGGTTKWFKAAADDALHLAELVDARREEFTEPWCALINFFNDVKKNAIGDDVEQELDKKGIVWTDISANKLHEEILLAQ
ncbi:hypothetical protein AAVH_42115, partial [Aphelenchoides avenae]